MTIRPDSPTTKTVLDLVTAMGVLRRADLRSLGIARTALQVLELQGPSVAPNIRQSAVKSGLTLRIVRFSPKLLRVGTEAHAVDGVVVQVTTPARTVADCFKYRRKIGIDVALAALRSYIRDRKGAADPLWREAVNCRVANVMRPYIEVLL